MVQGDAKTLPGALPENRGQKEAETKRNQEESSGDWGE